MSWAIGVHDDRDIGYGVPAICDHPDCSAAIDRGLAYVCGGEPYGGDHGCGRYFCEAHHPPAHISGADGYPDDDLFLPLCERCERGQPPFDPSPDTPEWLQWKLTDESWAEWRDRYPAKVAEVQAQLATMTP